MRQNVSCYWIKYSFRIRKNALVALLYHVIHVSNLIFTIYTSFCLHMAEIKNRSCFSPLVSKRQPVVACCQLSQPLIQKLQENL